MKILIMTPFWKRPEIVAEYAKSIMRLKQYADITLLAILSTEDPYILYLPSMIPQAKRCWVSNSPFGAKKNAGAKLARELEWDYLLELNSDSIVNPAIFELYKPYMDKGVEFFGLKDLYVVDWATKETLFIKDYVTGMTYGAGRMISREAFLKLDKPWTDELNEGMDTNMKSRYEKVGVFETPVESESPMLVELKTNTTLSHFRMLKGLNPEKKPNRPTVSVISYDIVKHLLF